MIWPPSRRTRTRHFYKARDLPQIGRPLNPTVVAFWKMTRVFRLLPCGVACMQECSHSSSFFPAARCTKGFVFEKGQPSKTLNKKHVSPRLPKQRARCAIPIAPIVPGCSLRRRSHALGTLMVKDCPDCGQFRREIKLTAFETAKLLSWAAQTCNDFVVGVLSAY
jgi:hypothetical protein